jgi:uncharacterized zinc-type alcohol dehydrogenase-like protein
MKSVNALGVKSSTDTIGVMKIERRNPKSNDVVVDIHFCGICHSDIHQARNEWGPGIFPMVPGHEISGVVSQVGNGVTRFAVGDKVGVGCFVDSCRECKPCKLGLEQYCEKGANFTYNGYERDGKTPTYGGYSTSIVVDQDYVLRIPKNLDLAKASPLLCAGITVYSPLRYWKVDHTKHVAVVGLGGLGHMAVKFAVAMGAKVTVISQTTRKMADAKKMGANNLIAITDKDSLKKVAGTIDVMINTVSAGLDWNELLGLLGLDGALVVVGIPTEAIPVHAFSLLMGRKNLTGSGMGGIAETQEMLDFCAEHNVTCDIELINADYVNTAYERILKSDVRYRFVIDTKTIK